MNGPGGVILPPTPPTGALQPLTTRKPAVLFGCGGCAARWSGGSLCHCSRCHRTFSGLTLFDRHQRLKGERGRCVDPATLTDHGHALVLADGVWRSGAPRPAGSWGRDPE